MQISVEFCATKFSTQDKDNTKDLWANRRKYENSRKPEIMSLAQPYDLTSLKQMWYINLHKSIL
jgi:hypothetical protein